MGHPLYFSYPIFRPKFFYPKFFRPKIFSGPKIFWTHNFVGPKKFSTPKFLLDPKNFLKDFFGHNIFLAKIIFDPTIFGDLQFFQS